MFFKVGQFLGRSVMSETPEPLVDQAESVMMKGLFEPSDTAVFHEEATLYRVL